GHVAVREHHQLPLGPELELEAAEAHDARVALAEEGAGEVDLAAFPSEADADEVRVVGGLGAYSAHHLDAARGGELLGVDVVDRLAEEAGEGTLDGGDGDRHRQRLLDAPEVDAQAVDAAAEQAAGEAAELLAEAEEGLAARAGGTERQVDGRDGQRAVERGEHHAAGLEGDALLRLD